MLYLLNFFLQISFSLKFFSTVLEIDPGASDMLGKRPAMKLHHQPNFQLSSDQIIWSPSFERQVWCPAAVSF